MFSNFVCFLNFSLQIKSSFFSFLLLWTKSYLGVDLAAKACYKFLFRVPPQKGESLRYILKNYDHTTHMCTQWYCRRVPLSTTALYISRNPLLSQPHVMQLREGDNFHIRFAHGLSKHNGLRITHEKIALWKTSTQCPWQNHCWFPPRSSRIRPKIVLNVTVVSSFQKQWGSQNFAIFGSGF